MKATIAMREWSKLSPSESEKLLKSLKLKGSPTSNFGQLPKITRLALIKHFNK